MSSYLDIKYIRILGQRLTKFKEIRPNLYNFRCEICGDSAKRKHLRRAYFYETNLGMCIKCHNCSSSMSLSNYLKQYAQDLYKEYIFEKFQDKKPQITAPVHKKPQVKTVEIKGLVSIADLPATHRARKYVEDRKIPKEFHEKLFYSDNYKKWVNENVVADKYEHTDKPDARIVIPFFNKDGAFAFQGRSLDKKNEPKYLTAKANDDLLIYGLERVDLEKTIYLVEGGVDSMFLENGLAANGSSLNKLISTNFDIVFIFDREPRNKEIIRLMEQIILAGKKIVIWDSTYKIKDINDMVIKYGLTKSEIMDYINSRVYSGLDAQLEFYKFKKV